MKLFAFILVQSLVILRAFLPSFLPKYFKSFGLSMITPASLQANNVFSASQDFGYFQDTKAYFVDKSHYIPMIFMERTSCFFRPQKFGKTLFLDMIVRFHDCKTTQADFDTWFRGLDVTKDSSYVERHSRSFVVLKLNLNFKTSGGPAAIDRSFTFRINADIKDCLEYYGVQESEISKIINEEDASISLTNFSAWIRRTKPNKQDKLMILIDEYDRAMNSFMSATERDYLNWKASSTAGGMGSAIKVFFNTLKSLEASRLTDYRLFFTGISPVFLTDISGFNNFRDYTNNPLFSDMLGFTEEDVKLGLLTACSSCGYNHLNQDNIITSDNSLFSVVKSYCNGYHFLHSRESLFNPFLCMSLFTMLKEDKSFLNKLLVGNIAKEEFYTGAKTSNYVIAIAARAASSTEISKKLLTREKIPIGRLIKSFSLEELLLRSETQNKDVIASFLYYHGILTLTENNTEKLELHVPNPVVWSEANSDRLERSIDPFEAFLTSPDTLSLRTFLQEALCEIAPSTMDNLFSENALCAVLQQTLQAYRGGMVTDFEHELVNDDGKLYSDIRIEDKEKVIYIELKRIRPNAIELSGYTPQVSWFRNKFAELREDLMKKPENELLNLSIRKKYQDGYTFKGKERTVNEIVGAARDQVEGYAIAEEKKMAEKKDQVKKEVRAFIAVQVAYSFVVQEVKF